MIHPFDARRDLIILENAEAAIRFSVDQFLQIGRDAINSRGQFVVALSGGQTPHAIYHELSQPHHHHSLDWSKVLCFWSDERSVPPQHPDSNYFTAMQAGLASIPLRKENIFRMVAENDIEENALSYDELIHQKVPALQFDLIMLGMGEDGHTASLFPYTHGLHARNRLVVANYVPQKKTWRMTMTYECIDKAQKTCVYVIGEKKASMVKSVLLGPYDPDHFPAQRVGTPSHKALWILDKNAAKGLSLGHEEDIS